MYAQVSTVITALADGVLGFLQSLVFSHLTVFLSFLALGFFISLIFRKTRLMR